MIVSAIPGYGSVQNIYVYHNTHFNQGQNGPVGPVQRAGRIPGISGEEDRLHLAATYQPKEEDNTVESKAVAKYTAKLSNSFDAGQEMQYDLSNPYEMSRMSLDGMLVAGMNIDVMA